MSRLEALSKALYYPTQQRVLQMVLDQHVHARVQDWRFTQASDEEYEHAQALRKNGKEFVAPRRTVSIVDPCCGEGHALAQVAEWLRGQLNDVADVKTYGVELHEGRAAEAKKRLDHVVCASTFEMNGSGFNVMLFNPPYADGAEQRQEIEFLQHAITWLADGGLLIYVVPKRVLGDKIAKALLARNTVGYSAMVLDYPEPEIAEFKQCVVIGERTHTATREWDPIEGVVGRPAKKRYYSEMEVPRLPWLVQPAHRTYLASMAFDPMALELPAYASATYKKLFDFTSDLGDQPLLKPRAGHQALLLAAGVLNGCELPNGTIVKGGSRKLQKAVEPGDGTYIERERVVSHIAQLDLKTFQFEQWEVGQDDRTAEWFAENGVALAAGVNSLYTPQFDVDRDLLPYMPKLIGLTAPGVLPGETTPRFLDIQVEVAAATAHRWKHAKAARIAGEMGTGKTTMGILAAEFHGAAKNVVVGPSHLVRTWLREIGVITGNPGQAVTAKKLTEIDEFFANPKLRYLVLSKETAKLGARWEHAFTQKRFGYTFLRDAAAQPELRTVTVALCPKCGDDPLPEDDRKGFKTTAADFKNKKIKCRTCKEPLWDSRPISAKTRRWPIAAYISKHYPAKFVLILDEAHQYASADSDQSQAVGALCGQATKILEMTGTLYGGRASSLFYSLHRSDPEFRAVYKYDERNRFVEVHGLFERVFDEEESTGSQSGYSKGKTGRLREIPGMTPAMIPRLLESTAFVKLKDLKLQLPPYSERVVLVDHDASVLPDVQRLQREVADFIMSNKKGGTKLLGAYLQACLGYPDCPQHAERIVALVPIDPSDPDSPRTEVLVSEAPAHPDFETPKDSALANIVWDCKARGRGVCVYFSQVGARDSRMRVKATLEAEGLKVEVLDASVSPKDREEWLHARAGTFDVLLTNGRLVETGLDLIWAHTIVQYGIEFSLHTLRQSSRRAWRLGQKLPCEVIYLGYRETMQEKALQLIAKKMRAAEMIDGDDIGGLGSHDEDGGNFLVELAQKCFGG